MVTIRWITPGCLNVNTSPIFLSSFQAVLSGNTEVPARNLHQHIQNLMQTDPGDNVTPMELEFKNLANVKAEPSRFVSANLQVVSMTTQTLRKNQPEYGNFHRNAFFALAFEKFT